MVSSGLPCHVIYIFYAVLRNVVWLINSTELNRESTWFSLLLLLLSLLLLSLLLSLSLSLSLSLLLLLLLLFYSYSSYYYYYYYHYYYYYVSVEYIVMPISLRLVGQCIHCNRPN